MLSRLGLSDRAHERCETLSGGLRRRVELAKGMLHRPRLLLLDEPSTGLDPAGRDLWDYLAEVRREGVTVVLTTHLLEEADRADRIAILSAGSLVALGTPAELRATVGGDSITIATRQPAAWPTRSGSHSPAPPRCSTAASAWSSPMATSGSPGWSRRSPARSTRSRSASRRSRTCSSIAPVIASGPSGRRLKLAERPAEPGAFSAGCARDIYGGTTPCYLAICQVSIR